MKRGVYAIVCVDGRAYVGGSSNISGRWAVHRYQLRRGQHIRRDLQSAWDLLGETAFSFVVLEFVSKADSLHDAEQRWMDKLNVVAAGFNRAPNSTGNTGIVFPPEVRANMSKAQSGKKLSPEHCAKIGERSRGHIYSDESRQKMSKARKGRFVGEKGSRAKLTDKDACKVLELSAQGLFKREIAVMFGVSRSAISHVVNGHTFRHVRNNH
jgi:group I intron endonuclease